MFDRWKLREHGSSLDVALFVQPRSGRNEVTGLYRDSLKIRITSPPVDNAANEAVIDYFASRLKIPKSRMSIVSGQRSRTKTLRIEGYTRKKLLESLGIKE